MILLYTNADTTAPYTSTHGLCSVQNPGSSAWYGDWADLRYCRQIHRDWGTVRVAGQDQMETVADNVREVGDFALINYKTWCAASHRYGFIHLIYIQ